jgi:hypothetical protein
MNISGKVFAGIEALSGYFILGLLIASLSNMLRIRSRPAKNRHGGGP